jgi:salicylate 1-O-methyltransferase
VLRPGLVDLGWSSYCAMLASRVPASTSGHRYGPRDTGVARAEFERQSSRDWKTFLQLRSAELRPGGRLVVVVPADDAAGSSGAEAIMDHASMVLAAMVGDQAITAAERARMLLGVWPRSEKDLLAPFAPDRQFQELMVEHCETADLQDSAWAGYQRNGNREVLAGRHAAYFRSLFAPSLSRALAAAHDPETVRVFGERLEQGLRLRLLNHPAPINSRVGTIVLRKRMRGRLVSRCAIE